MPKADHRSPPAIPEIHPEEEPEKMFSTNEVSEGSSAPDNSTQRPVKSARDSAASLGVASATSLVDRDSPVQDTVGQDEPSAFQTFEAKKKMILLHNKRQVFKFDTRSLIGSDLIHAFHQSESINLKPLLRDTLLKKTLTRIKKFDEDVKTLYLFKVKLDEQLTISQLYLDTLQQELILLKVHFWPLDDAFLSIALPYYL